METVLRFSLRRPPDVIRLGRRAGVMKGILAGGLIGEIDVRPHETPVPRVPKPERQRVRPSPVPISPCSVLLYSALLSFYVVIPCTGILLAQENVSKEKLE